MAVPSPSPSDQAPSKEERRAKALEARRAYARALDPDTRAALQEELARHVLPHIVTAGVVALYHPLKDEISPYPIMSGLLPHQQAGLPWFGDRDARMMWRAAPAVEPSPWGVLQPAADAPVLVPDLVIVPFVLADRNGTRIGHGKGHYDRALAHLRGGGRPVVTIGIGWDMQLVEEPLIADPWDQPLHAVATPKEFIWCRN